MTKINSNFIPEIDNLQKQVVSLIEESRSKIKTTVNTAMLYTYYGVGYYIVEFEQRGKNRSEYGKNIIIQLSQQLTQQFGAGWSEDTLERTRKFYLAYSISATMLRKSSNSDIRNTVADIQSTLSHPFSSQLSWSHYLILMRIRNVDERNFYEKECEFSGWNVRQLQRQVASSLYERIALSTDKETVIRLANEGYKLQKPDDLIKDPLTLEFLGLKHETTYSETKLEQAIIDKMQDFLLEMGKGFLFEKRQKRFTFDEQHFFVDLVFYNRLLQCYVLIDLKIDKLTHQDLGQMQMYVNYYDRFVRQTFEKPTIGILLCKEKNDALVELTLPKDANIYAQQYALYLPEKKLLQQKLQEWIETEEKEDNL